MSTKNKIMCLTAVSSALAIALGSTISGYADYNTSMMLTDNFECLSEKYYSEKVDNALWSKFLKYDLCISDYDNLTQKEKELCKFIFNTEMSASHTVRCERARHILNGESCPRITREQALSGVNIEADNTYLDQWNNIVCVPDIMHLDSEVNADEYWLDDNGDERLIMGSKASMLVNVSDDVQKWAWNNGDMLNFETEDKGYTVMSDGRTAEYQIIGHKEIKEAEKVYDNENIYQLRDDGTAALIKYIADDKSVVIPDEVEGHKVTAIAGTAFDSSKAEEITLPETVKFIGKWAFGNCEMLKKVSLPKTVERICTFAFIHCVSLEEINIDCPKAVIDDRAFFELENLKTANINVKTIGENVFEGCKSLENIKLGNDVKEIGAYCFKDCEKVSEIVLPEGLEVIGCGAFDGTDIDSVSIPKSIKHIGKLPKSKGSVQFSGLSDYIPSVNSVKEIEVEGYYDTTAHSFAIENNVRFFALNNDYDYGDIDGNDKIDENDLSELGGYLTGKNKKTNYAADANRDGKINVIDSIVIKRLMNKKEKS